jgi:hypothetical protein
MVNLFKKAILSAAVIALLLTTQQAAGRGGQAQTGFRIKITVPDSDRPEFYVPARAADVKPMFALMPALADKAGSESESRPSYIKVIPQAEGDSVRIKVAVLYGKLDKSGSTGRLKGLKEKPVADFLASSGEKVSVSELKRFGVRPLEIEVVSGP